MSKSRFNVVNPDDIVEAYGADSLRLYEMFIGPLEMTKPWQTSAVHGMRHFLERAWRWSATMIPPSVRDWSTSHPILSSCACSIRLFER